MIFNSTLRIPCGAAKDFLVIPNVKVAWKATDVRDTQDHHRLRQTVRADPAPHAVLVTGMPRFGVRVRTPPLGMTILWLAPVRLAQRAARRG